MDNNKARAEVLTSLPPRHARGCPQNIVRSALWHLATCDLDPRERVTIIAKLREILPCLCPKGEERDASLQRNKSRAIGLQ